MSKMTTRPCLALLVGIAGAASSCEPSTTPCDKQDDPSCRAFTIEVCGTARLSKAKGGVVEFALKEESPNLFQTPGSIPEVTLRCSSTPADQPGIPLAVSRMENGTYRAMVSGDPLVNCPPGELTLTLKNAQRTGSALLRLYVPPRFADHEAPLAATESARAVFATKAGLIAAVTDRNQLAVKRYRYIPDGATFQASLAYSPGDPTARVAAGETAGLSYASPAQPAPPIPRQLSIYQLNGPGMGMPQIITPGDGTLLAMDPQGQSFAVANAQSVYLYGLTWENSAPKLDLLGSCPLVPGLITRVALTMNRRAASMNRRAGLRAVVISSNAERRYANVCDYEEGEGAARGTVAQNVALSDSLSSRVQSINAPPPDTSLFALEDLDQDGLQDLIFTNVGPSKTELSWVPGLGLPERTLCPPSPERPDAAGESFGPVITDPESQPPRSILNTLAISVANVDGKDGPDLAVARQTAPGSLVLFTN